MPGMGGEVTTAYALWQPAAWSNCISWPHRWAGPKHSTRIQLVSVSHSDCIHTGAYRLVILWTFQHQIQFTPGRFCIKSLNQTDNRLGVRCQLHPSPSLELQSAWHSAKHSFQGVQTQRLSGHGKTCESRGSLSKSQTFILWVCIYIVSCHYYHPVNTISMANIY